MQFWDMWTDMRFVKKDRWSWRSRQNSTLHVECAHKLVWTSKHCKVAQFWRQGSTRIIFTIPAGFYRFHCRQLILAKKMVVIMVIVIIMIFSTFPSGRLPIVRGKHNCLCGTNTFLQKLLPAVSFLFSSKNAHSLTASLCLKGDCGQAGVQLSLRRDSRSNPS